MIQYIYKLRFFYIFFILLINVNIFSARAKEYQKEIKVSEEILTINHSDIDYVLGEGDTLDISFYGLELFSGKYTINPQGYLILPEVEYVYAKGKTIEELKEFLLIEYNKYLIEPDILIAISGFRTLNVTLRGEVNQTGLFKMSYESGASNKNNSFPNNNDYKPPRLFDLIQQGQGVTINADLKNIIVVRDNPLTNGGGKIKTKINLIDLLEKGDQTQNIALRDGDDIFISRSEETLLDQLNAVNKSNLTPSEIQIFINGNIRNSGSLKIQQGASLYEAIAASGELSLSGKIELVRLSNSGNNEKRFIAYNKNSPKGTYNNPILLNGDIITVRKNILGKTTQAIKEYGSPIVKSYAIYKIFEK